MITENLPTGETFSEGSDLAQANASLDAEAGPPAAQLDSVPINALAMPDEKEQMTPPEVGDQVNYTVTGTVKAIVGGVAQIERETINGNELELNESPEEEKAEDDGGLMAEAGQMDKQQFGNG